MASECLLTVYQGKCFLYYFLTQREKTLLWVYWGLKLLLQFKWLELLKELTNAFLYLSPPLCFSFPPQTPEELDDSDFETEDFDSRSRTSVQTEDDQLIAGQSARVRAGAFVVHRFGFMVDQFMEPLRDIKRCPTRS